MTYNVPNTQQQGGSLWQIGNGGSLNIASGGALTIAAGGSFVPGNNAINTPGASFGSITIGGTSGRWAFGSAALTSGTVMVYTGLSQVVDAGATPITAGINAGTGAGTATSFQIDLSRAANGSVFFLSLTGTLAFTGAGTITWRAFGY